MRPLEWALIQYDWCPYKERKFGHIKTDTRNGSLSRLTQVLSSALEYQSGISDSKLLTVFYLFALFKKVCLLGALKR